MKSLKIEKPGKAAVEDVEMPTPGPTEILIKVMACGICGTDVHIFMGEYFGEYPVIPGHEFSGIVEEIGSDVTRFRQGDHVAVEPNIACNNCYNCLHNRQNFCLNWDAVGVTLPGGMAQYVLAPEENTFKIGNLPFEAGAFMEPLSSVIHGLQKVHFKPGDKIAILGAGPIGLLMIQTVRRLGVVEITSIDKNIDRLDAAEHLGVDKKINNLNRLKKDFYDVVVDATGATQVMRRTLEFVRPGGTVLLFGVPPKEEPMEIEPFTIFKKGLSIFGVYTSVRNSFQAITMLQSGIINYTSIISHKIPLEKFQSGVEIIRSGSENVRKVLILPNP